MRHKSHKKHYLSQKTRQERKILAMLAFFSVSVGLWENFRQLWLQDNGFSATDVSTVTSIATFLSIAGVIFVGRKLRMRHLSSFMAFILGLKLVDLILLLGLNQDSSRIILNLCTSIDIITSYLIVASVYPLITMVMKNNHVYSKRKLVEYIFRDVGVLVGSIAIGFQAINLSINYTFCLIISITFLIFALLIMFDIHITPTEREPNRKISITKYITHNRLQTFYMLYAFLAATSFAAALGLKMLVLTNYLNFSPNTGTNYLLIVGLLSDFIGAIALKYFTPKNDYVTITLKFSIRLVAYIIAVIADSPFVSLLAITWSILISTAYENVSDGCYINLVDNQHQFSYSTIKHVMTYLGEAVGMMLCGWMYNYGVSYIFGLSALITCVQLAVAYYLIYLRHSRRRIRHSASRMRYSERLVDNED